MFLAALTGGIGSGKTTVAAGLQARGASVIDADLVAREIVEPGGPALGPIVERFGANVVKPDGRLDRAALASVVFSDGAALADLNAITHPLIGAVVLERLAAESGSGRVVVLDVPLLSAQTVQLYRPRALVIVDTPEDVAADRLVEHRGFTPEDARARIAAQVGRADRLALIDLLPEGRGRVVSNAGDRAALEAEIDRTWEWLQALAGPGLMDTGTVPRGA